MNKIELLDYQINDYNAICEGFKNNKMLLYISATGNGKSYITGKYILDNEFKALVITPTTAISRQWEDVIECDTITYQKLYRCSEEKLYNISSIYDFFVIDEAHHAGAPTWGKNINKLKNISGNKRIIGLTANPIRYNDCETDISLDIFDNSVVRGRTLIESIEEGILPKYDFVTAFYENPYKINDKRFTELSDEDQKRAGELIHRLNININKDKLKEIIYNHLPTDKRKIIVFVPDINSINDVQSFLDFVFYEKDYKSFSISSHKSYKKNAKILEEFEMCENEISTLITIDMLNEGRHISGVNTLFMIRQTKSPQIYLQQMGRSMSSSNKTSKVVIYDFVRNKDRLEYKFKNTTEFDNSYNYGDSCEYIQNSNQCIKYSYTEECIDMLNELEYLFRHNYYWTEEEDTMLKEYYPIEGISVYKRLLHRPKSSVRYRLIYLGLHTPDSNYATWTSDEDAILIKYFPTEGRDVYIRLSDRDKFACEQRAYRLGLRSSRHKKWSDDELAILKEYYPIEGPDVYKRLPGRDRKSCISMATRINACKKRNENYYWTEEEDTILKEYYPIEGPDVYKRLPGRDRKSCISRASKFKIKYTMKNINNIIKNNFPSEGVLVYKRIDGMTPSECLKIAKELGLLTEGETDEN